MTAVQMDDAALRQARERLSGLAPRLVRQVREALKPLLYQSLRITVQKYFSGSSPVRGPAGNVLTSRSGNLLNSVLESLETTGDGTTLNISIGSNLPYAAIHEYGGFAGRRGPFKKKNGRRPYIRPRPYLRPTINDLQELLPGLVEQAIRQVKDSQ